MQIIKSPKSDRIISRLYKIRKIKTRQAVQLLFMLITVIIGFRFAFFVSSLSGAGAVSGRPAGVEAFLPISSLVSLVYLIKTGVANRVHPAGLIIFSLSLALSFLFRRGFCSWVCPIGTISEYLYKAGKRVLGRNIIPPKPVDHFLRLPKYFLLLFFLFAILKMSGSVLEEFIHDPYNRIVDVKMYLFFRNISTRALEIIFILAALSFLIRNFWCRFLCPYGALVGLFSLAGPLAVERDVEKCTSCGACRRACPNCTGVAEMERVNSAECTACYSCIEACPTPEALRICFFPYLWSVPPVVYGAWIVGAFILAYLAASGFHYWRTDTTAEMYRQLFMTLGSVGHP